MTYAALTNWKYDKALYQRIQSGPQRTASDLNLTNTYLVVSSGYTLPNGYQQSYYGVNLQGADFGHISPGPPNSSGYLTTEWRSVPPAVSGYWTGYTQINPHASGALDSYVGYRQQGLYGIANATVQTAIGPEPGLRNFGSYTYYTNVSLDSQLYSPFNTPDGNSYAQGITGGPGLHPRAQAPALTYQASGVISSSNWVYSPPMYCQAFSTAERTGIPETMSTVNRYRYRGKSSRYVANYGSTYGVLGEGVRALPRSFSPGTKI